MALPHFTYLDSNATTEVSHEAAEAIMDLVLTDVYGNPSSTHEAGIRIRQLIEASRASVSQSLGCSPDAIIFTSGGTEANNIALRGIYNPYASSDNYIVISDGEHSSVENTVKDIAGEELISYIPLNRDGSLDLFAADKLITEDTALVSVMLANNETGVIFPVKEITDLAHSRGVLVHCDAVQAYGKIPINVKELGVDLLTVSGHKVHALPGSGALYVREGVQVRPMFTGGSQERGLRAGSENFVAIASLGAVADNILEGKLVEPSLRNAFELGIKNRVKDVEVVGQGSLRVPNTTCMIIKGVHSGALLHTLNMRKVYVSAGSACSSGLLRPPKTIVAMGVSDEEAQSTVRVSFSKYSTMADTAYAIEMFVKSIEELRG